jgi:hypothetical protein
MPVNSGHAVFDFAGVRHLADRYFDFATESSFYQDIAKGKTSRQRSRDHRTNLWSHDDSYHSPKGQNRARQENVRERC